MTYESPARSAAQVPGRFWIAACVWAIGAMALSFPAYRLPYDNRFEDFLGSLVVLAALPSIAAAFVTFVRPYLAMVLAALPLLLAPLLGVPFHMQFGTFLAMLGVAFGAMWRKPTRGWLFGALALTIPLIYCFWGSSILHIGTVEVQSQYHGVAQRLVSAAMYLAAVTITLWVAHMMRRDVGLDARTAEVDERTRLACDLHDVVAHRISLVAVRAETAPYSHPDLSPEARTVLADIASDARLAMEEMREVLGVLHRSGGSPDTSPQPRADDVSTLVAEARAGGTDVQMEGEIPELGDLAGTTAYRIVQEALTNVRRHAAGQEALLQFEQIGGLTVIRVINPAAPGQFTPGRGLSGMRERLRLVGGELQTQLVDGQFVLEAVLPGPHHD